MSLTTHVLDASLGQPAVGVAVKLEQRTGDSWIELAKRTTDEDGRIADLAGDLEPGVYRLVFDTGPYFGGATFYPEVAVTVQVHEAPAHQHVPLLLSPWAYTTYRGS
jgi:5-hydroxyisourate hydrolase